MKTESPMPITRRTKPQITVSASGLVGALRKKMGDATFAWIAIQDAEKPAANEFAAGVISDFLRPARGVYMTAKTYGDNLPEGAFKDWLKAWEANLTQSEVNLWDAMQDERDSGEHGEGPALISVPIPIPGLCVHPNPTILGLGPQPHAFKGGYRFEAYPNKPASQVCGEYLELCRRFVDDFLRIAAL